jgi:hypothetical protein
MVDLLSPFSFSSKNKEIKPCVLFEYFSAGRLNSAHFRDWSKVYPVKEDSKTKDTTLISHAVTWWNGYPRPDLTNSEVLNPPQYCFQNSNLL